jgi:hypothetical protein
MMSPEDIKYLSDEAAVRAANENKEPYVFWDEADVDKSVQRIPNIGSHVPKGWEEDGVPLFVDSSGMGAPGELAWTFTAFVEEVKRIISSVDYDLGWAIVEEGQFQVYIQAFRKS